VLSAHLDGVVPLAYTWTKNSVILDGATGATLTLPNMQTADAGFYNVTVRTSSTTLVTGLGAAVEVIAPSGPAAGDRVWAVPAKIVAERGANWGFTVVGGVTRVSSPIQWYKDGVLIPGATGQFLSIPNIQAADQGDYYAVVEGFTSSVGHLALNTLTPVFELQPLSTYSMIGGSANFGCSFAPDAPVATMQWFKDGIPIPGATISSFAISSVSANDYGTYTLVATNTAGSTTSQAALLEPYTPPVVTLQPQEQTVALGGSATLTVAATGQASILPLSYQWQKNGMDIPGATSSSYTISNAQNSDAAFYRAVVSGRLGPVSSFSVAVTVDFNAPVLGTPGIGVPPQSTTATEGDTVSFTVLPTGAGPMAYAWEKNGTLISGAGSATLTLTNVQASDAGDYRVTVTNALGTVTSTAATLTVSPRVQTAAPAITRQPESVVTTAGSAVTFSVTATGAGPLSYTWKKDGKLLTGLNGGSTLTLPNVQSGDEGSYEVSISSPLGAVTSVAATLHLGLAPGITIQPAGSAAIVGGSVVLTVGAQGQPTPSYQWLRNGVAVANGTQATLLLGNIQPGDAGSYAVVVSNAFGSATSASAEVSVSQPVSQAGIYFGGFGPGGKDGQFGLQVRPDGTAILIGYLTGRSSGFAVEFRLKDDGSFSALIPALLAGAKDIIPSGSPRALADGGTSLALKGAISGDSVTGQSDESAPFSGNRAADAGAFADLAGGYVAPMLNTANSTLYSLVGADGRVLVVTTGDNPTAGQGSVTGSGAFSVRTANGAQVEGAVDPKARTLSGGISQAGASAVTFSGLSTDTANTDRLANISTRGRTGLGDEVMIAGFILSGSTPRQVLIRAIGPTLTGLGVGGALTSAQLELYRGSAKIAEAGDWSQQPNADAIATVGAQFGAFGLASGSKDAALLVTLDPGAYTAQVRSPAGATGVTLVEVYDAGEFLSSALTPKLVNISTRGRVGVDDEILIAGIIVGGNTPKRLLVRAIGPTLESFGVAGVLADPELTIFDGNKPINSNDDWAGNAEIASVADSIGAFPLPAGSKDAVLMITLAPGVYTAQVRGKGNTTGNALVEVYEIPDQIGAP
jgi:hypothetical protein